MVPAIIAPEQMGFEVSQNRSGKVGIFVATRGDESYAAGDPVTTLGLIKLIAVRGKHWRPSVSEIDATMTKYALR